MRAGSRHAQFLSDLRCDSKIFSASPIHADDKQGGRLCEKSDIVETFTPLPHALEQRQRRPQDARSDTTGFHVGLTSIIWREAWKYGERAFRYCQHDAGHALAALRFAAAALGWRVQLLPGWNG